MSIDPKVVFTILNLLALLGVLCLVAWLGIRILRGQSGWAKLLLPILALIFVFAALVLVTFPLTFGGSAESQQQVELDL